MAVREIKTIFALDGERKYTDAIKSINAEQRLLNAELKKNQAEYDLTGDKQASMRAKIETLNKQIDLQRQKVNESRAAMELSRKVHGEASETTQELTHQYYNAEAGLSKLQKQLIESNKDLALQESKLKAVGEAAEQAGNKMKAVGDKMSGVGSTLSRTVTAPILALATAAVMVGNKYEQQMDRVGAISQATAEEMAALDEQALKLGSDTKFSASEVGLGMENLASAGFTASETMQAIPGLLDMAAASGTDLATASDFAASTLRQFGLDASEAGHVADVFAKAAAETNAQTQDLGESMKYVGPVAKSMGITLEEAAAAVGILADAGIKGEQAGTTLRGALTRLVKPTTAMKDVMAALNIDFFDSKGNMKSLAEISEILKTKTAGLSQEQRNNAMVTLFGKESLSGMLALVDAGPDKLKGLTKALEASDGAAADMAKTMMGNAAGSIEEMMGSLETAGIKIQKSLAPTIIKLADTVGDLADKFSNLTPEQQESILKMAAFAAAAGPVLKVTGEITKTVGGATAAFGKYAQKLAEKKAAEAAATLVTGGMTTASTGLMASLGPLTLVIAGVAAAAGAAYLGYREATKGQRELGETAAQMGEHIQDWSDDVSAATSVLNNFDLATLVSSENMSKWDNGISDAQEKIVGLAERAASESRAYTEKETAEINKLIGLINDYTQKKIDAYLTQQQVVSAMAARETEITLQEAQNLVAGAEDAKAQTLAIADSKYKELIGLAETTYGHLGEKDKEAYDAAVVAAESSYQAQVDQANAAYSETLEVVTNKYADFAKADDANLTRLTELNSIIESENQKHNDALSAAAEDYENSTADIRTRGNAQRDAQTKADKEWHDSTDDIYAEIATIYQNLDEEQLGSLIAMVANTEMYGGKLDEETQKMVDTLLESFENMPEDAKKKMGEVMQGMMEGLKEKDEDLFTAAAGIASGVLGRLKKIFQIASPSKAAREITNNVGATLALGLEDEKETVIDKAGELADGVLGEASRMSDMQAYLKTRVQESGLGLQIDQSRSRNASNSAAIQRASSQGGPAERRLGVYGEINVNGVNTKGETVATTRIIIEQIKDEILMEMMLAGG